MGSSSTIEWTDATWNPWQGCHKISPGCKFCYMFRDKKRYGQDPNVVVRSKTTFNAPLKWEQGMRIFTCSWSDWYIKEADAWRGEAWEIIHQTPRHTYQILTKRIERAVGNSPLVVLPNVHLGVSVENARYKHRIDILRCLNATVRFLSIEPLIGDVGELDLRGIGWVIVGGESGGRDARPMNADWVRGVRDQCIAAKVPFFFKQWGANPAGLVSIGTGRMLDGREWNELPVARMAA